MKIQRPDQATLRLFVAITCFSMTIVLQAFALPQLDLDQPISIATVPAVEQDSNVMPVGCTDSCCGCETANGKAVCCPKRVTKEVKKHCWKVKGEQICIPGFRFQCNWKKWGKKSCDYGDTCCTSGSCTDCPPQCGRVRCINVLEKHEATCEKCGYEWEVKYVRSKNKGGCCSDDCPSCGCAAE